MKKIKGFAFHCHHGELVEYVTDYNDRVKYIKKHKPKEEQEVRLRLFKMIPEDRLPADLIKASEACVKASEACVKAWETRAKAWETRAKAREAYDKAWEAYDKAWETRAKAWEAYDKAIIKYTPELEKLHKELCPDCPWDGYTIFPKEEK